jgi:uracil-DNA glycosylase
MTWAELGFWNSDDWVKVQTKLSGLLPEEWCPGPTCLFASLEAVSLSDVRVMVMGQDPYPTKQHATGIAFSVPKDVTVFPPTLRNIFDEYEEDLHLPRPATGDLTPWCSQGVFLWNAIPSCRTGQPGTHNWPEWQALTREIVITLSKRGIVFAFLGAKASSYQQYVDVATNETICVSHPSPLGYRRGSSPFYGSRLFSTINDKLADLGKTSDLGPIDWTLS